MKLINKYSRRKFIGTASISGISVLLGSSYFLSACSQKEKITDQVIPSIDNEVIHKISCQLYTFRNQMKEDLPETIQKVAQTGLKYVETFDFSDALSKDEGTSKSNPKSLSKLLKSAGLSVSSMHGEIPVGDMREKALAMAEAYDCTKLI